MSKLNKKLLGILGERVDKFEGELDNFVEKVVTPKRVQLEETTQALNDVKKKYDDIVINGIDDTVVFLETKDTLSKLEDKMEKSVQEYDDVLKLQEEFELIQNDKIYNDLLKYGCENYIGVEFNENMLMYQKQMYKKFLEIEKICNQMEDLEKEYQGVIRRVDHPRTGYVSTGSTLFINQVHNRFNVNRRIEYYTGVTTDKSDFEY